MEIIKRNKKWILWRSKDAEGRDIYACGSVGGEEPGPGRFRYTRKAAIDKKIEDYRLKKAIFG